MNIESKINAEEENQSASSVLVHQTSAQAEGGLPALCANMHDQISVISVSVMVGDAAKLQESERSVFKFN